MVYSLNIEVPGQTFIQVGDKVDITIGSTSSVTVDEKMINNCLVNTLLQKLDILLFEDKRNINIVHVNGNRY